MAMHDAKRTEIISVPGPNGAGQGTASNGSPSTRPGDDDGHLHEARFDARAVGWGVVVGLANAAAPMAIWWLEPSTVHAIAIALIAAVYIGLAVADGRPRVIAVECGVAALFVVLATVAVTVSPWLLVVGYLGHGCKDLWQHRTQFVTGTRWWPPFCAAVDFTVAAIIAIAISAGTTFH
jgi:hypothetical protein